MPVIVPPVPMPATKWVTWPSVCARSRAGRRLVRGRIGRIEVLVGLEGARDLAGHPLGDAVVALRALARHGRRADHHVGAVGAQQGDLLVDILSGMTQTSR